MLPTSKRLGELLISQRLLTPQQLEHALKNQRTSMRPLGEVLVSLKYINEEQLLNACAFQKGVRAWHLQKDPPTPEAISTLSGPVCRNHLLLPVKIMPGRVIVAMSNPLDIDALDMVSNITKLRAEPVLASLERLVNAINDCYGADVAAGAAVARLVNEAVGQIAEDGPDPNADVVATEAEMRPVVGIVSEIVNEAVRMKASDIHFEPRRDAVLVRYRVDGQMLPGLELPKMLQAAIITRIKILSSLDIVEYRVPQDGRMSVAVDGRNVDMRVSVLPNYHGQRIVLRILDKAITLRKMTELGFSNQNMDIFGNMIDKPCGLVLVTGPTGSGKTTTLYAAINQLKQVTTNIMTCEDPVEYEIEGISQSQVNEKVGLTFAAQLRSILRQDPDIILVGEIRDKETADTAIQASLTGHLVLSTLHCNDASAAVPRLADMGIEPMLLSSALVGITAQRLVRMLCPDCKVARQLTDAEKLVIGPRVDYDVRVIWDKHGCPKCNNTGYRGRLGIHEVLPMTSEIKRAISLGEPIEQLAQLAAQYGFRSMQDDAIERVLEGATSFDEARRHIFFDHHAVHASPGVDPPAPAPLLKVA